MSHYFRKVYTQDGSEWGGKVKYVLKYCNANAFNNQIPTTDWISLNNNIVFTSRQRNFITARNIVYKISSNKISNRFWHLNGKISLDWLNMSFTTFKINCKRLLLSSWVIDQNVTVLDTVKVQKMLGWLLLRSCVRYSDFAFK